MPPPITRVQIFHFRHRLKVPVPTGIGPLTARPAILLRLEDAEGAEGWGEIWCNFPPDGDRHRAQLAAHVLPRALSGLTADTAEPFALVAARLHRLAIQTGEYGPVNQIASGVDIALHDLRARRAGVPLAVLLGGTARPVPAYASGISPTEHAAQIDRMRGLGYRTFKIRIGFGPGDSLDALRDAAQGLSGPERLMADVNQAWDLATALARVERLAPLNLLWLEEPLAADSPADDWRTLARAAPMRLAGGENLSGKAAFAGAIASGAYGVIQPDICKWGGLSAISAIARQAVAAGLDYCPHFLGGGVGLIASAHLLSAVGGGGLLEVDSSENPLLEHFSGRGLALRDGQFPLSDGPGLGYVPDVGGMPDLLASQSDQRVAE